MVGTAIVCSRKGRHLLNYTDRYDHVIAEVLVASDKCVALLVLEAHALGDGWARVQPIEILDCCDNGIRCIMLIYGDTQGQARTVFRRLGKQEFEGDGLGRWSCGGPRGHTATGD